MFTALLVLGLLLIAFGVLVLLRYSDRPGATIKWLGAEITSSGAGLPLVALGVGCILFAAVRFPSARTSLEDPLSRGVAPAGLLEDPSSPVSTSDPPGSRSSDRTCVDAWLAGMPSDRVRTVEVGMRDVEIIGPHQSFDPPFGVVLTENGDRIGAVRLRLYRASNSSSDLYKVEEAIDADCEPVREIVNASRGGNPREVLNWDTLRLRLGENHYEMRIGGEGDVSVGRFYRVD